MLQVGQDEECFGSYRRNGSSKYSTEHFVYNIIILGWTQRGDVWEAVDLMQPMKQEVVQPNIHTCISFVNGCCKAGGDILHHLGRKRKSSILGMELSQGENTNLDLDLNIAPADLDLNLAPAGNTQNERSNQWGVSSPSSQRSCMSLMEDLEVMEDSSIESSGSSGNTTTNQSPELPSLVVMGCSNCLIYVMVSEADPRCPKCKGSERLMDMFRQPAQRSRKS